MGLVISMADTADPFISRGNVDPEFSQMAATFRKAIVSVIGLTVGASLAEVLAIQPTTTLGLLLVATAASATALVAIALTAWVLYGLRDGSVSPRDESRSKRLTSGLGRKQTLGPKAMFTSGSHLASNGECHLDASSPASSMPSCSADGCAPRPIALGN
jgi:hypothetical protein